MGRGDDSPGIVRVFGRGDLGAEDSGDLSVMISS